MKQCGYQQIVYRRARDFGFGILLCFPLATMSAPVTYVDLALGLGVHVLDDSDQGAASKLIKAGLGVQWLPFLTTQVGIWSWNSADNAKDDPEDEADENRVGMLDSLSASWEVAVQWPIDNGRAQLSAGPYYRYGRHCWSAVLTGLLQPWSKKGCSDLNTLGFSFPMVKEKNAGVYIEFTRTDFDDLSSSSLQLGAKLAF